jgi:predicted HNH restriction endonuclease
MAGGSCLGCGYQKCLGVLSFHHVDPTKKDFNLSSRYQLRHEYALAEFKKCVLVCANCHGELHACIKEVFLTGDVYLVRNKNGG